MINTGRPFRRDDALATGLTLRQLQSRRYRPIARGVHIESAASLDLRTRCEAMGLVMPDRSIFSHYTAAELYDVPIPADALIHISLVSPIEPRIEGVAAHRVQDLGRVWTVGGFPVTSPGRTFVDLAARLDLFGLVAAGDRLARRAGSTADLQEAIASGTKRRGIKLARTAVKLVDPRADSAPESRMRLLLVRAGLPPPQVNEVIYDRNGRWIAKPDISYLRPRLGIEYEGAHHLLDQRQWDRDIERDAAYRDNDWYLIKVTKTLLFERPDELVRMVADALERRRHLAR